MDNSYNISDFIPYYPDIQSTTFNYDINRKKEFRTPIIPEVEEIPDKKGTLFAHQILISKIMSSYTPYNGILLMHDMGTGKTCSASAIIQQIMVEKNGITKFIFVAKNSSLLDNFEDEFRNRCTKDDYSNVKKLSSLGIYKYTYDGFLKDYVNKNLKNSVVIIDEVHNIKGSAGSFSESSVYNTYVKIFRKSINSKLVLLSGTPVTDKPNELASIMNLLLPVDEQLPTGAKFNNMFIENETDLKNKSVLINAVKGRVSYIKSMKSNVTKDYKGDIKDGFKYFKLKSSIMSSKQTRAYVSAIEKDEAGGSPAFSNSLQASDIVVDGNYGVNLGKLILKGQTHEQKLEFLSDYSSKYSDSIRDIIKARKEGKTVFVFNRHVDGGGLKMFASLLSQFGFSEVTRQSVDKINSKGNRFVLLTGSASNLTSNSLVQRTMTVSKKGWGKDIRVAVKRFNKDDNANGDMIGVVLASEALSEGYSFKNVQMIDIHSPWFNFAKISQVIARGVRVGSHKTLLEKLGVANINVEIFLRISIPGIVNSKYPLGIDAYAYKTAENKDIIVKKIEHLIKENSIDSRLARKRNFRDESYDYSRDCDYLPCNYESFPEEKKTKSNIDYSTYEYYYSDELDGIINEIKTMFTTQSVLSLNNIVSIYDKNVERPLVNALRIIINNDSILINNGKKCFLREQNNIYYLVNTLSDNNSLFDSYYVTNLYDSVYKDTETNQTNQTNLQGVNNILDLNFETRSFNIEDNERLLESNIPNGNAYVLEKFSGMWGIIDGVTYSWLLLPSKCRKLQESNWVDCSDNEKQIVINNLERLQSETSSKALKLFGDNQAYYGLYNYTDEYTVGKQTRTFSIFKVTEQVDKRKKSRGLRCNSFTGKDRKNEMEILISQLVSISSTEVPKLKNITQKCNWIENIMSEQGILIRDIKMP